MFALFSWTPQWQEAVVVVVRAAPAHVVVSFASNHVYGHVQEYLLELHLSWFDTLSQRAFAVQTSLRGVRDPPDFPDGTLREDTLGGGAPLGVRASSGGGGRGGDRGEIGMGVNRGHER